MTHDLPIIIFHSKLLLTNQEFLHSRWQERAISIKWQRRHQPLTESHQWKSQQTNESRDEILTNKKKKQQSKKRKQRKLGTCSFDPLYWLISFFLGFFFELDGDWFGCCFFWYMWKSCKFFNWRRISFSIEDWRSAASWKKKFSFFRFFCMFGRGTFKVFM